MQNFADQCLDVAESMLGHNLGAINKDGTITIVDYKTDQLKGQTAQRLVEGYEPQLGGYALVLENLGFKVGRAVLVFADGANDGSALEYTIPDLEMAKRSALNQARETLA